MATDICIRRLTKELKSLKKDPIESPKIIVAPNESNILEMHYVIEGGEKTPYHDGIYWGKLIFPKEYPLKPPSVIMLTPSGRFHPNRRLCLSMSDFHPEVRCTRVCRVLALPSVSPQFIPLGVKLTLAPFASFDETLQSWNPMWSVRCVRSRPPILPLLLLFGSFVSHSFCISCFSI